MKQVLLAAVVLVLVRCATTEGAKKGPCPAKPSCLTVMKCDWDSERQCDVCVCSEPMIDRGAEPPPGQPPFQR
jgi:hypothetical protein